MAGKYELLKRKAGNKRKKITEILDSPRIITGTKKEDRKETDTRKSWIAKRLKKKKKTEDKVRQVTQWRRKENEDEKFRSKNP